MLDLEPDRGIGSQSLPAGEGPGSVTLGLSILGEAALLAFRQTQAGSAHDVQMS
jgi:hypothetical protein